MIRRLWILPVLTLILVACGAGSHAKRTLLVSGKVLTATINTTADACDATKLNADQCHVASVAAEGAQNAWSQAKVEIKAGNKAEGIRTSGQVLQYLVETAALLSENDITLPPELSDFLSGIGGG